MVQIPECSQLGVSMTISSRFTHISGLGAEQRLSAKAEHVPVLRLVPLILTRRSDPELEMVERMDGSSIGVLIRSQANMMYCVFVFCPNLITFAFESFAFSVVSPTSSYEPHVGDYDRIHNFPCVETGRK